MPSSRYLKLLSQIAFLKKQLLPHVFSATGDYAFPDRVIVRTLSFRVLAHAEIEHYLEERVIELAKTALFSWQNDSHYSPTLVALAAFSGIKFEKPPSTFKPLPKDQKDWSDLVSPNQRIERCVTQFIQYVQLDNHGIREKNLASLLLPVGYPADKLPDSTIEKLDELGSIRGEVAHKSATGSVTIGVDPQVEYKRISDIADELIAIDDQLDELISLAKAPVPA